MLLLLRRRPSLLLCRLLLCCRWLGGVSDEGMNGWVGLGLGLLVYLATLSIASDWMMWTGASVGLLLPPPVCTCQSTGRGPPGVRVRGQEEAAPQHPAGALPARVLPVEGRRQHLGVQGRGGGGRGGAASLPPGPRSCCRCSYCGPCCSCGCWCCAAVAEELVEGDEQRGPPGAQAQLGELHPVGGVRVMGASVPPPGCVCVCVVID